MAASVSGQDIGLIFGLAGGGTLGGKTGVHIREQLADLVDALNTDAQVKNRKLKFSLDVAGTKQSFSDGLKQITSSLSPQKQFQIKLKLEKIDASAAIRDFQSKIQGVLNTLQVKNGMTVSVKDFSSGGKITGDPGGAKSLSEASARAEEYANQLRTVRSLMSALGSAENKLFKIDGADTQQVADLAHRIQDLRSKMDAFKNAANEPNQGLIDGIIQETEAIKGTVSELQVATRGARNKAQADMDAAKAAAEFAIGEEKHNNALKQLNTTLTQAESNLKKWTASKNGRSSGAYAGIEQEVSKMRQLEAEMLSGQVSADGYAKRIADIKNKLSRYYNEVNAAGEATKSFTDRMGGLAGKFNTWFSLTRVIMAAYRAVKQMVTNVIELDSAMTQLQIVTGATDSTMTTFLRSATVQAKELGQSITDVLKSIETFSRLGYNLDESSILAKYTGILANVANVSSEEATTGVTSIIKGYQMDVDNTEHVADVLIEVGQKYAVSAAELMEAFEKSGAALNATNTSFEKSAGLIAAANASVQNASTVGTALKTVSARIRGSKSDLEELGEDVSELADGFSKYATELRALTGFNIMVDGKSDTFKDIYDIFDGLAGVWDKLSDTQQARVAEILGGTRQLQVISSILGNWKDAAGAYKDAMESAGTATEANAIYMDSIEGKVGQFKATFQELSNTLIGSDFVKQFVELGTGLLEILNSIAKLVDAIGGLNTVLGVTVGLVVALNSAAIAGKITQLFSPLKTLVEWFGAVRTSGVTALQLIKNGFAQATVAANGFQIALGVVGIALTVFTAIYAAYQAVHKSSEELRAEYEETTAEVNELNSQLQTNKERMEELNKLYESGVISIADEEELQNLRLINDELERKLRLKREEQEIEGDKTNKSLENDWSGRRHDNYDLILATTNDLNAMADAMPKGVTVHGEYASVDSPWDLSEEELERAYAAVDAYNAMYSTLTKLNSENVIASASEEEYIERLISRYNELTRLGTKMTDEQIKERNAIREELVSIGNTLNEDFIDKYVGNGDSKNHWKDLVSAIDETLYPAEHNLAELQKLPNRLLAVLNAKASRGKLTADEVTQLASGWKQLDEWMDESGYTAQRVADHFNALAKSTSGLAQEERSARSLAGAITDIDSAKDNIDKISTVLDKFKSGGAVGADSLEPLIEVFGKLDSFQNFVDVLTSASSTMAQAQQAADALGTEWVNQIGLLNNLNDENAAAVTAMLEMIGVTNATSVVEMQLAMNRYKVLAATEDCTDAVKQEAVQLLLDAGAATTVEEALDLFRKAQLNAKIAAEDLTTATSGSIGALLAQAKAAGASIKSIAALTKVQELYNASENGTLTSYLERSYGHDAALMYSTEKGWNSLISGYMEEAQFSDADLHVSVPSITVDVPRGTSSKTTTQQSNKEIEKYIADIDRLRERKELLRRQELKDSRISDQIARTDDSIDGIKERIRLTGDLIEGYEEEQRQLHELAGANAGTAEDPRYEWDTRRAEILEKINEFESKYGIQIQYNADTNELLCDDLEKINDLTEDRSKQYATEADRQEAQNKRIKEAEELYEEILDLNDENIECSAQWEENAGKIHEEHQKIVDDLKQIVEVASSIVDEVQDVYDILQKAADEYAANDGFISVDTFQDITSAGLQYMQYLTNENGLLEINRDRINDVIKARTEQMALEAADSYVQRVKMAAYGESQESLDALTMAQDANTLSTWNSIEAQLEALYVAGKLSEVQYDKALQNVRDYRMILTGVNVEFNEHADKMTKANEAMDKILEYTIELVKQQVQDEIDGLNDLVDQYQKLIDAKKEALDKTKEEDDYADEILEKTKKLAKLRTDADLLRLAANSGDRAAEAKLAKNLEEQSELQKEIDEKQRDHSIEAQKEALDKMADNYKEQKEEEIDDLEKSISSQQKLYDKAIDYIDKHWDTLYSELVNWNYEYGSAIEDEITQNWVLAKNAMDEYKKSYVELVQMRNAEQYGTYDATINKDGTSTITQTGPSQNDIVASRNYSREYEIARNSLDYEGMFNANQDANAERADADKTDASYDIIRTAAILMKNRSKDWKNDGSQADADLVSDNEKTKEWLNTHYPWLGLHRENGVWYTDSGEKFFDKYKVYHTGGIVGGGTLKENEQLAVLQSGEPIISNTHKRELFDLVDFATLLSNRLGDISPVGLNLVSSARNERLMERLMEAGSGGVPNIHFGDVYIYGGNEETVRKHKEVSREFANEVLKYLRVKP